MDPEIICGISSQAEDMLDKDGLKVNSTNQLRTLDLRWSGNSAVLRAWSEPEGLPSLPHLRTVNIFVPDDAVVSENHFLSFCFVCFFFQKKNSYLRSNQ